MSINTSTDDSREPLIQIRSLRPICVKALKRSEKKREKQGLELAEARSALRYQHFGDSILAQIQDLRRGMSTIELPDIHDGTAQTIALNPALSPQENAAMYYRKAKKARRGIEIAEQMALDTAAEIATLTRIIHEIDALNIRVDQESGASADESLLISLEEYKSQLQTLGLLPRERVPSPGREQGQKIETVPYRRYTIGEWEILVGKNDRQNDELSTRYAKPWDIWLHVAGHAGSHVVIRQKKNAEWPPREIIIAAASFAIWFSKAKHTSYAEVHVTERRFVRKRHGAPAGEVIAERCKSVRTAPCSPQVYFKEHLSEGDDKGTWD